MAAEVVGGSLDGNSGKKRDRLSDGFPMGSSATYPFRISSSLTTHGPLCTSRSRSTTSFSTFTVNVSKPPIPVALIYKSTRLRPVHCTQLIVHCIVAKRYRGNVIQRLGPAISTHATWIPTRSAVNMLIHYVLRCKNV